jgi:hypothetical protein
MSGLRRKKKTLEQKRKTALKNPSIFLPSLIEAAKNYLEDLSIPIHKMSNTEKQLDLRDIKKPLPFLRGEDF